MIIVFILNAQKFKKVLNYQFLAVVKIAFQ